VEEMEEDFKKLCTCKMDLTLISIDEREYFTKYHYVDKLGGVHIKTVWRK
jgi:hypothetical protein